MKSLWEPDQVATSILSIDFKALHAAGRRHYIIDVDNTLVSTNEAVVKVGVVRLLRKLRNEGVIETICLVSNIGFATEKRIGRLESIAEQLEVSYITASMWYGKPHRRSFMKALTQMGAKPATTVVIGDQLFTDIQGGNQLGMYTILVTPLGKDHWMTKYRRWLEKRWEKRGNGSK